MLARLFSVVSLIASLMAADSSTASASKLMEHLPYKEETTVLFVAVPVSKRERERGEKEVREREREV